MERRVSHCLDVHGRHYGPAWAAYDGKLPSESGWPRNPVAPLVFNVSVLERELNSHEREVARTARHKGQNASSDLYRWALRAARGRAASTQAELLERRRATGIILTAPDAGFLAHGHA